MVFQMVIAFVFVVMDQVLSFISYWSYMQDITSDNDTNKHHGVDYLFVVYGDGEWRW